MRTCHWLLGLAFLSAPPALHAQPAGKIAKIEHLGEFLREPNLEGERRSDDVVPGQTSAIRLSKDRWLILCCTRGFRGIDDERSVVYQLRKDAPEGKVLKEGFLAKSIPDWQPPLDKEAKAVLKGLKVVKQHGHGVACGVPKGARIGGKPAATANQFVALWRVLGVPYDPDKKAVPRTPPALRLATQGVEWVQFRLNDAGSDIDIVQPVARLRQAGFDGEAFCSLHVKWMNQSFVPPVPASADCSEWLMCNHFDGGRIAALKLAFSFFPVTAKDLGEGRRGVYKWVQAGPLTGGDKLALSEASLARIDGEWIVAARVSGKPQGVAWSRTKDPLRALPEVKLGKPPATDAPCTVFRCGDGVLRIFTGDFEASPRRRSRDPLFLWQVNPETFACTGRTKIFDTVEAKLPFRNAAWPKIDFARLFPLHGKTQLVTYRVNVRSYNFPYDGRPDIPPIRADEKGACGVYYSRITYDDVAAEPWSFE
jgi:hypothetical protein